MEFHLSRGDGRCKGNAQSIIRSLVFYAASLFETSILLVYLRELFSEMVLRASITGAVTVTSSSGPSRGSGTFRLQLKKSAVA